jgi:hypothetical protein
LLLHNNLSIITVYNRLMSKTLAQGVGELAQHNQYVLLGDTAHDDPRIVQAVSAPPVLQGLADAGVKHLFLELPASTQPLLDQLTEGVINPQAFARQMAANPLSMRDERGWLAVGELAQRAAQQHGIKVYAADERADRLNEFIASARSELPASQMDFESVAAHLQRRQPVVHPDGSVDGPLTNDRPLADFIRQRAGADKAVVLFGEAHGGRPYDLDEMLGGAARVQLFASEKGRDADLAHYGRNRLGYTADPDPPALRYYADTRRVEEPGSSDAPVSAPTRLPSAPAKPEGPG